MDSLKSFSEKNEQLVSGLLSVLLLISGGLSLNLWRNTENDEIKNKLLISAVLAGLSGALIVAHSFYGGNPILGVLALVLAIASFVLQYTIKDEFQGEPEYNQFWGSYWVGVVSSVLLLVLLVGLHTPKKSMVQTELQGIKESIESLPETLSKLKGNVMSKFGRSGGQVYEPVESGSETESESQ